MPETDCKFRRRQSHPRRCPPAPAASPGPELTLISPTLCSRTNSLPRRREGAGQPDRAVRVVGAHHHDPGIGQRLARHGSEADQHRAPLGVGRCHQQGALHDRAIRAKSCPESPRQRLRPFRWSYRDGAVQAQAIGTLCGPSARSEASAEARRKSGRCKSCIRERLSRRRRDTWQRFPRCTLPSKVRRAARSEAHDPW